MLDRPVYLDCNATSPLEPVVAEIIRKYSVDEYGNAGSRTHVYGSTAKKVSITAREQVAKVVDAQPEGVIFTSGATESNNLAILGLEEYGSSAGKKHIITTAIEHKAVLEPIAYLRERGFDVTLIKPSHGCVVDPDEIAAAMRADTLLVSVMHVNNETGTIQSIEAICEKLGEHDAFFHIDAAQGYGKDIGPLTNQRIDMMSVSAHKIYGPKGIGALIIRRRDYKFPPLKPLMYGGGQERRLRPGTLPVHLVAGFGCAAELARKDHKQRSETCRTYRKEVLAQLRLCDPLINGDPDKVLPHVLNISFPGTDSESLMVSLKDFIAISNGSACTSESYEPSHVLNAMRLDEERIESAVRISWCHMTERVDWHHVAHMVKSLA